MSLFPREDTIDDLHMELGQARREYLSHLRAPGDGRAGEDWDKWKVTKLERVRRLEAELADAQAEWLAAQDALGQDVA